MPGGTCQDGVNIASKWRIDGVFWTCALKRLGQVFTIVGLLVNLYSVYITLVYITLSPWRPFGNLSLLVKYSNAMFILCLNSLPWNNLMDIVDCIFHFHMSTTWISPERDKILRNRERLPYSFRTHQNWSSLFIRIDVEKHVYIRLEIRV